jgi:hypothetical protein
MRTWIAGMAMIAAAGLAAPGAAQRATLARHAEHYALASCLTEQAEPYLKEQGYGLGAIVDNRAGGAADRFAGVRTAVAAELKRRPMAVIRGDGPVGAEKRMPIAHCVDVVDAPGVRAAIGRAAASRRGR